MNEEIFNIENLVSSLKIVDDSCFFEFERNNSVDVTSNFFVMSKKHNYCVLMTENFENNPLKIGFKAKLTADLFHDGSAKLKVNFDLPEMKSLVNILNNYIKIYMCILDISSFHSNQIIHLNLSTLYSNIDTLKLEKLSLDEIVIVSLFETDIKRKEINILNVVDSYLEKMNLNKVNSNTNILETLEFIKIQKTIDQIIKI